MKRKRYAIVGTGDRGLEMFARPLTESFTSTAHVVALVDANGARAAYVASKLPYPVPTYTDFETMMVEVEADGVIIATRDDTHARYVIAALRAGKRVFSEKPLCVSAAQCRAILKTAAKSSGPGGQCFTTHNSRYGPAASAIRRILKSGVLGNPRWVQFDETLDRNHGGDYFRRWHRHKANSGGLQIHKASHHFDLLNWWLGAKPATVRAEGGLAFYGKNNPYHGTRCRGCAHARQCRFRADVTDPRYAHYMDLYVACEHEDGYDRDGCVWDPSINIEDELTVHIAYDNGVRVNYTLIAYAAIESMRVVIEGTKGRLEMHAVHNGGWALGNKRNRLPNMTDHVGTTLRLSVPPRPIVDVLLRHRAGGHGGADPALHRELFARDWALPPTERMASLDQAVQAVLIGHAVNRSLASGRQVRVQELLKKG